MFKRLGGLLFLRRQLLTAWFALRDTEAPRRARLLGVTALLYALIPVDLVPDVIPLFGWLDDLGLLGIATTLILRASPSPVLQRATARAESADAQPRRWIGRVLLVLGVWLLVLLALGGWALWQLVQP